MRAAIADGVVALIAGVSAVISALVTAVLGPLFDRRAKRLQDLEAHIWARLQQREAALEEQERQLLARLAAVQAAS